MPSLAKDLLEQISFEARESEYIDVKSGVSARMSITAFENLLSTAERRSLQAGDDKTTIRLGDFMGMIPAITGKVELVYEGEQEGAASVAHTLIGDAIKTLFVTYFPEIKKLEKQNEKSPYDDIVTWFFDQSDFQLLDDLTEEEYKKMLNSVIPLERLVTEYQPDLDPKDKYFMKEFILWALVEFQKLSKYRMTDGMRFKDLYGSYISGL